MPSKLGEKIRKLRTEKGYSLDHLAELTASSKTTLWELENREMQRPSAERIGRIAAALEVTAEYLLDDREVEPSEEVADQAFYRKYRKMPDSTKKQLRKILDAFEDD